MTTKLLNGNTKWIITIAILIFSMAGGWFTLKAKADERIKEHYKSFLKYFGDDLVIFADGLSMASTMQKKDRQYYKSKMTKKELSEFMKKHNLKDKNPNYSYPKQLIESSDGIGVYFNPQEGQEIMVGFNEIVSGFKKKGKNLTVDEKDTIISFIESNSISPNFINRIIREYSYESITAAFLIMTNTGVSAIFKYRTC
ncbi:hypothetical protein LCGC14_1608570 [marine sediment metagenome]|uniref:Uncharacterized protein n=1 Tax=marine sediment metagenome TaxID=412755 RepID=A0A0F9I9F3_9ZZZZ